MLVRLVLLPYPNIVDAVLQNLWPGLPTDAIQRGGARAGFQAGSVPNRLAWSYVRDRTCPPYVLLLRRGALVPQFHCLATRCCLPLNYEVAFKRVPS